MYCLLLLSVHAELQKNPCDTIHSLVAVIAFFFVAGTRDDFEMTAAKPWGPLVNRKLKEQL